MLSRKNYVAIANALNKTSKKMIDDISTTNSCYYITQELHNNRLSPAAFKQQIIENVILRASYEIANYFEDDNPSFDRDKFRAAVWK